MCEPGCVLHVYVLYVYMRMWGVDGLYVYTCGAISICVVQGHGCNVYTSVNECVSVCT